MSHVSYFVIVIEVSTDNYNDCYRMEVVEKYKFEQTTEFCSSFALVKIADTQLSHAFHNLCSGNSSLLLFIIVYYVLYLLKSKGLCKCTYVMNSANILRDCQSVIILKVFKYKNVQRDLLNPFKNPFNALTGELSSITVQLAEV